MVLEVLFGALGGFFFGFLLALGIQFLVPFIIKSLLLGREQLAYALAGCVADGSELRLELISQVLVLAASVVEYLFDLSALVCVEPNCTRHLIKYVLRRTRLIGQ